MGRRTDVGRPPDQRASGNDRGRACLQAQLPRERCLVPADGFYEWLRSPDGRQPFYTTTPDGSPLAFAGLWSAWRDRASDAPPLLSCTIPTTTPNALMAPIHNRMPAILPSDAWEQWLDTRSDPDELLGLLRPFSGELLAYPVAPLVNSPRHQGPTLVAPLVSG